MQKIPAATVAGIFIERRAIMKKTLYFLLIGFTCLYLTGCTTVTTTTTVDPGLRRITLSRPLSGFQPS